MLNSNNHPFITTHLKVYFFFFLLLFAARPALAAAPHEVSSEEYAVYMQDRAFADSETRLLQTYAELRKTKEEAEKDALKQEQLAWAVQRQKYVFDKAAPKGSANYLKLYAITGIIRRTELQMRMEAPSPFAISDAEYFAWRIKDNWFALQEKALAETWNELKKELPPDEFRVMLDWQRAWNDQKPFLVEAKTPEAYAKATEARR